MGEVRRMSAGFQDEIRAAIEDAGRQEPDKPNLESVARRTQPAPGGTDRPQPQATDDSAA